MAPSVDSVLLEEVEPPLKVAINGVDGPIPILRIQGSLNLRATTILWERFPQHLGVLTSKKLNIDVSQMTACDASGMAMLHHLERGGMTANVECSLKGLRPEFETIYRSYHTHPDENQVSHSSIESGETKQPLISGIGRSLSEARADLIELTTFLGHILHAMAITLFSRRHMRWAEVGRVFELAGINALPIVSLISLLVGLIIAFESAQPLAQFGAQIFIANMIGLIMIRELGPMMTAIIIAGRSGSAFAAEIGTMKVNEELNALQTMGLDPVRFLVIQRVVAGVLLTPLLTIYSMFMGVLGGVIVMRGLGFPLVTIFNQIVESVHMSDVLVGTLKGCVFGLLVSLVGCLRGLQTKKGPAAVGEAATRSVVSGILLIIVADAVFSLLLFVMEG